MVFGTILAEISRVQSIRARLQLPHLVVPELDGPMNLIGRVADVYARCGFDIALTFVFFLRMHYKLTSDWPVERCQHCEVFCLKAAVLPAAMIPPHHPVSL